jgi:hypothetical protein
VTAAAAGTQSLIVYYTNGDAFNVTGRYLQFVVNGSAPQVKAFGGLQDWSHPRGASITLSGWNAGGSNTVYVTGDNAGDPAPDLDWIEVLGTDSALPTTGFCTPSLWKVSASVNGSNAGTVIDGGTDRWSTGRPMQAGDYFQVDFQGMVKLSSITLDNSNGSSTDFPSKFVVFSSQDGTTWGNVPADAMVPSASGTSGKTVINFGVEAVRAVRIQVLTPNSNAGLYWSIGSIQTDCSL